MVSAKRHILKRKLLPLDLEALGARKFDRLDKVNSESGSEYESCDENEDSDRELQIAFESGLLKSDTLNVMTDEKRPVINKKEELKRKATKFYKRLPWLETLDVTVDDVGVVEAKDDFEREILMYKQAQKAAILAIPKLQNLRVKIFRPADYYAEMAKSDSHMQKIRKRIADVKEGKERQDAIRKVREEKKFAAKVKKEAIDIKQSEKKKLVEAVKKHRKGMKGQLEDMLSSAKLLQQHDENYASNDRSQKSRSRGIHIKGKISKLSRKARDKRYGFGGQKKRSKTNSKESFNEYAFPGSLRMDKKGRIVNHHLKRSNKRR